MTAYEAVQSVRREERRKLIAEIKALARKHGYIITGQINIKETSPGWGFFFLFYATFVIFWHNLQYGIIFLGIKIQAGNKHC